MDKDLLKQALSFHGPTLYSMLKCEQYEHLDFRNLLGEISKCHAYSKKERKVDNIDVQQFIARKADLLFSLKWKPNTASVTEKNDESEGYYAVMPPLEQFMDVPNRKKREMFFRDVERGDVVIGRISSIREFGFFIVLSCLGSGILRDVLPLEINALCPLRDVPSHSSHGDPLSYYQTGDLIQAVIKDIDRYHEKLSVSLQSAALPSHLSSVKLGVIPTEDLPIYYKQSIVMSSSASQTYEKVLHQSPGFVNPSTVEVLLDKLGINESNPPSLMRCLQRHHFSEEDYATTIRKKQSALWALKCVKIGVDYFKVGRHVDAMNEYNKALEIDAKNVEALVARGALYATKGSLNKAIDDFEIALENCPTHRNARKYLCQTLVERGGQLEEEDKLLNAESYYKKALTIDENFHEAEDALLKLRQNMQKKRKRSTSSSSTSSGTSSNESYSSRSSSASSGHRKHKKQRSRNRSESSSHLKKKSFKVSSHGKEYEDDEWYPPPANTSASFLDGKQEIENIFEKQDRSVCQKVDRNEKGRYRSLSSSSVEILETIGGRSEESRDSFCSSKPQTNASKAESQVKADRTLSSRRDSTGSSHSRSGGRNKAHYSGKLDKEVDTMKDRRRECRQEIRSTSGDMNHTYKCAEKYTNNLHASSFDSRRADRHGLYRDDETKKENRNSHGSFMESNKSRDVKEEKTPCSKDTSSGSATKKLPPNLLNIFSQIAEFQKEKGINK
ncbi:tetratricopeptide repeat protein 14 isoform X2 [Ambystoma mexicanum]|uniref:tetratricopeptide repeat protein 14 isoform X2 n=1 Tax=Ambystoma mexicanum TaxID=8296 RepID=UPI0037E8B3C7